MTYNLPDRFWAHVDRKSPAECWEWTGSIFGAMGYGRFNVGDTSVPAHRAIMSAIHGELPRTTFVCHHCDNPRCVNPAHLFLGSNSDNQRDSVNKGRHPSTKKTHCPHGHPYTDDNVILDQGGRKCRACKLERHKRAYQARKAAWLKENRS